MPWVVVDLTTREMDTGAYFMLMTAVLYHKQGRGPAFAGREGHRRGIWFGIKLCRGGGHVGTLADGISNATGRTPESIAKRSQLRLSLIIIC
jgi:hypothetical protein